MSNRCGYDRKAVGAGESVGAIEHAFDPRDGSPAEQIKDLISERGADVTIEISGSTKAFHEAQLDRFMIKLSIGYPSPEEGVDVLKRRAERKNDVVALQAIISPDTFLTMRAKVEESLVDPMCVATWLILVTKSWSHRQVAVGVSPRRSLALLKLRRAWAAIQGREYVIPDDIKPFTQPAMAHCMIMDPSLWDIKRSENTIIAEVPRSVSVPVLKPENE